MFHIQYVVETSVISTDYHINIPEGFDHWLMLFTKTPTYFTFGKETVHVAKGYVVVFPPGTPQVYGMDSDTYIDSFITFAVDSNAPVMNQLPITSPVCLKSPDIVHSLIHLLAAENISSGQFHSENIDALMKLIINHIADSNCTETDSEDIYEQALSLKLDSIHTRIQMYPSYNWTISGLAKETGLSEGYFQVIYKKTFHISCMNDVIQSRITRAKVLLQDTNISIKEVSLQCGYKNVEHFSRQFKKWASMSPAAFRKLFRA